MPFWTKRLARMQATYDPLRDVADECREVRI